MHLGSIPSQTTVSSFEEATIKAHEIFRQALVPVPGGRGWICPLCGNGTGDSKTGITEVPGQPYHYTCYKGGCFASGQGESGDVFDLVANEQHLAHGSREAMEATNRLLGIVIDRRAPKSKGRPTQVAQEIKATKAPLKVHTEFYKQAHAALLNRPNPGWDYLISRGLPPETITNSPLIGYCPDWYPSSQPRAKRSARIILGRTPTTYLARAIDPNNPYPKQIEGTARDSLELNIDRDTTLIWVVEGELDAYAVLSALDKGNEKTGIIALGSTSNATRVAERLLSLRVGPSGPVVILCLDNDEAGIKATNTMLTHIGRQLNVFKGDLEMLYEGTKDPADAFKADPGAFKTHLRVMYLRYLLGVALPSDGSLAPDEEFDLFDDEDTEPDYPAEQQAEPDELIDLFGDETDVPTTPPRVLLTDHLATTCAVCPSIQAVKAGTKTPAEHCKTCQSCRKNLKGYATLALYGGLSLLESEITPTALLDTPNSTPEQGTADPEIVFLPTPRKKPQPKGKTATYYKRYGKAIRQKHAEGKSANKIAQELAIAPSTVRRLLDEFGLERKHKKQTQT